MGDLGEQSIWEPGIRQIERTDAIDAGVGGAGLANLQPKQLANRTRFLFDRSTAIAGGVTALKAIAAPTDGLVRLISQVGFFVFDSSSVDAEDLPWVATPDDATPGRWLHIDSGLVNDVLAALLPSGQLKINDGGFPTFVTSRTLVRCAPIDATLISTAVGNPAAIAPGNEDFVQFAIDNGLRFFRDVAGGGVFSNIINTASSAHWGFCMCLDAFLHDGASLAEARLNIKPAGAHGGLPAVMPGLGILRYEKATGTVATLKASGNFTSDPSASLAAYETEHAISVVPDQNNIIERSLYTYVAVIFDEGFTNAKGGMTFRSLELHFNGIADMRFA